MPIPHTGMPYETAVVENLVLTDATPFLSFFFYSSPSFGALDFRPGSNSTTQYARLGRTFTTKTWGPLPKRKKYMYIEPEPKAQLKRLGLR